MGTVVPNIYDSPSVAGDIKSHLDFRELLHNL